jgi:hypothetical protein
MTHGTLTHDDLLAITPGSVLDGIFAAGASAIPRSTAELALVEQLRAGAVPRDALELTIVGWSGALDGLAPGPMPAERLARLDRTTAIQSAGIPALAAWLAALRPRIARAEDLDRALQFLLAARQLWLLGDALPRR